MKIHMSRMVYEKVMYWVRNADHEVSGFGKCVWDQESKTLEVLDAELLDYGTAAETEISGELLSQYEWDSRHTEGDVRWWWHSHVDMSVFWSGTDKKNIEDFAKHGWIAATVFNRRAESRSAIVARSTVQSGLGTTETLQWYDELPTYVIDPIPDETIHEWASRLDAVKAARKKPEPTTPSWLGAPGWWEDDMLKAPTQMQLPLDQDEGLLGVGLIKEANALGMKPLEYRAILDSRNMEAIYELEEKLLHADKQGRL